MTPPPVSADDRMLVALHNTLQDQPNVVGEGSVAAAGETVLENLGDFGPSFDPYVEQYGITGRGVPEGVDYTAAMGSSDHLALLVPVAQRLEGLGYTVNGITVGQGSGYVFNLEINGRPVSATLYPAGEEGESLNQQSFLTRMEFAADVLRSPAGGGIASVDIESHTTSVSFRMNNGGTIFLDQGYISPIAFQRANRAYQALGRLSTDEYPNSDQELTPIFTQSVMMNDSGQIEASYYNPSEGDMPHVALGSLQGQSAPGIRQLYTAQVRQQLDQFI